MRKRSNIKPYLVFLIAILCLLSIPVSQSITFKGFVLDSLAPLFPSPAKKSPAQEQTSKLEKLGLEIKELSLQNRHLESALKEQLLGLVLIQTPESPKKSAISAKVLYRSPLFWSDYLIIDTASGINKGSPVIAQGALIGVVDYVGKRMSRVRLITDEGLQPSVRVVRGKLQDNELLSTIKRLILNLESRGEGSLTAELKNFSKKFSKESDSLFLAKGVLQGKSQPLWRSSKTELKGFGFNYDFSDEHGPARDLLTGKADPKDPALPLIKAGDLLVTSGLDGVFPEGLPVATVKKVEKLKEGDFCFGISAIPCADNLQTLTDVFVLPSQSFHEESFIMLK